MIVEGEFSDFVSRQNLDETSKKRLIDSTKKILNRTDLLDGRDSQSCQLVVGEVQSGKTMSFTSLIALAHDNGFPLIIVLAGTKENLLIQTSERLQKDLKTFGNGGANPWQVLVNPGSGTEEHAENVKSLKKVLEIWNNPHAPREFKSTVIITALKNVNRMDSIGKLISDLRSSFAIDDFPVLIVDDEGDEAGLNLEHANDGESAVYAAIRRLRSNFKKHSYVMYTATPQGPLVLKIQDSLSPKYVTLLKSGQAYLGGEELFLDQNSKFVKVIPDSERALIVSSSINSSPPPSLKESLAYFLLALFVAQERQNPRPLSMLIHPSVKKDVHTLYKHWVESVLATWRRHLSDDRESIFQTELRNYFLPAEEELRKTVNLPDGWNLAQALTKLQFWISRVEVRVINSDKNDIDPNEWLSKSGWILIGGNKLSRGYTIENLAVTYMPRNVGVGNVDVIQQRGRFFGYKRGYKDLLRGWFFDAHIQAYLDYVQHEQTMRNELLAVDDSSSELAEWRRKFLLDPAYRLVRRQVISLDLNSLRLSLFKQQQLFASNLTFEVDRQFDEIKGLSNNWEKMDTDKRSSHQNYFSFVDFDKVLNLVVNWKMSEENRKDADALVWAASAARDRGLLNRAAIILMDSDSKVSSQYTRERSLLNNTPVPGIEPENQSIHNLFQGSDRTISVNYPGDDEMKFDDALTLQIHRIRPNFAGKIYPTVLAVALLFPGNLPAVITENA